MKTMRNNLALKLFILFCICAVLAICFCFTKNNNENRFLKIFENVKTFFQVVELKTFDARQQYIANSKETSKDIVIVEIDEKTYSAFTAQMGEWPVSRSVYADVLDYIEQDKPKVIGIDLMFINTDKYNRKNDVRLANTLSKYENIFTSINFNNEEENTYLAADLPSSYKINLENLSTINLMHNRNILFSNCRTLIPEIMNSNAKVANINSINDIDGTLRAFFPFAIYKNEYYPHLSIAIAKYLYGLKNDDTSFKIDENANLLIGDKKIPIQNDSAIYLNWYPSDDFNSVSFWDVYNASKGQKTNIEKGFFKDKIIYIGATATALFDLKSTPVGESTPGVQLHTTFINNLLNNNFIKLTTTPINMAICLVLCSILVLAAAKVKKKFVDILIFCLLSIFYVIFSFWIMEKHSIWLPIVIPVISMVLTFTAIYIVKYALKARDFEYTYKLATTDGLTELYNHRFFQEQLAIQIETAKRYKNQVSLIILDIDFFKKFNDKYGHQAGDAVLRFVAQNLKKSVRLTDIVCRYGGEEMTIILPNTTKEDAIALAQKICNKIGSTDFKINSNTMVNVTISLGVATYPVDASAQNELIEFADSGLYFAKENGRNQVGIKKNEG